MKLGAPERNVAIQHFEFKTIYKSNMPIPSNAMVELGIDDADKSYKQIKLRCLKITSALTPLKPFIGLLKKFELCSVSEHLAYLN